MRTSVSRACVQEEEATTTGTPSQTTEESEEKHKKLPFGKNHP